VIITLIKLGKMLESGLRVGPARPSEAHGLQPKTQPSCGQEEEEILCASAVATLSLSVPESGSRWTARSLKKFDRRRIDADR